MFMPSFLFITFYLSKVGQLTTVWTCFVSKITLSKKMMATNIKVDKSASFPTKRKINKCFIIYYILSSPKQKICASMHVG